MATVTTPLLLVGGVRGVQGAPASAANPQLVKLVGSTHGSNDLIHGGRGRISGTVKEKSTPSNIPLRRKVRLHREVDGLALRETWSAASTGAYVFTDINPAYTYYVVSFDYVQNYRAVVADNLTPDIV